jgi:hypothetical protein
MSALVIQLVIVVFGIIISDTWFDFSTTDSGLAFACGVCLRLMESCLYNFVCLLL